MNNSRNFKLYSIAGVIVLIGIVLAFFLYSVFVFRVTKIEPDPHTFPTITPYIDIYFSKPLDRIESYTLNEEVVGTVAVDNNRIRYTPSSIFTDKTDYVLSLKGIHSKTGDTLDYAYKFTAIYMNYSDVPKEIQKASVQKSSSGQIDDPFFNNYFPMQTTDFQIEYPHSDTEMANEKILYVTFLKEVYNYDTGAKYVLTNEEAEQLHAKVIEYITTHGGKPNDYAIFYSNQYLNEKYPQKESAED